jgi:hypothetical protein
MLLDNLILLQFVLKLLAKQYSVLDGFNAYSIKVLMIPIGFWNYRSINLKTLLN